MKMQIHVTFTIKQTLPFEVAQGVPKSHHEPLALCQPSCISYYFFKKMIYNWHAINYTRLNNLAGSDTRETINIIKITTIILESTLLLIFHPNNKHSQFSLLPGLRLASCHYRLICILYNFIEMQSYWCTLFVWLLSVRIIVLRFTHIVYNNASSLFHFISK